MYQTKFPLVLSWNYVKNLQSFNDFYLKIGITFDGSVIGHPVDSLHFFAKTTDHSKFAMHPTIL